MNKINNTRAAAIPYAAVLLTENADGELSRQEEEWRTSEEREEKQELSPVKEEKNTGEKMQQVVIKNDVEELRTQIKGFEKRLNTVEHEPGAIPPFGEYTGYALCGMLASVLVMVVILWIKISKLSERLKKELRLEIIREKEGMYQDINMRLADIQEDILRLSNRLKVIENRPSEPSVPVQELIKEEPSPMKAKALSVTDGEPEANPPSIAQEDSIEDEYRECIDAYNLYMNALGTEARMAKQAFFKNHRLHFMTCRNFAERIQHAELIPEFAEENEGGQGNYCALPLKRGGYAVVPNIKPYDERQHLYGGMKEVFQSNFAGGTYNKISVLKPAIFDDNWHIEKQGELMLR